ncbi:MAG: response regulator, partial [Lachnospiraceae bacterium]|nr:response regulator [Lachnospiraceae bacterium]
KTLLFLINDILDMSKIESGKMEIVPVEYETADMILDLWNVIYLRAQEKGLTVDFIIDNTLPRTLYGDDVRIKQIVTNLLTNAVKYTSKGGIELRAEYSRIGEKIMDLIISVKDTGMGIRQEDMGKLFESFRRIEEKKNRNIEGTGLGMNIVMSLLELMGGDIEVDSEYQMGSTFTVTIPQRIISDEATGDFQSIMGKQISEVERSQQSFVAPGVSVLVVDDNTMNLAVFQALLKRTKMNIVTADSGRKCLELVKEQSFDIIFMDHMMPEMDGIETLHEIQKLNDFPNEETPVVALTANAFSGARESYLKEGFKDFLTKPIDADLLEQMILSYLPEEMVQITEPAEASSPDEQVLSEETLEKYDISLENGLSLVKGDMETYLDIVDLFLKDRKRRDTMQQFIAEQNMGDYSISVHSLKGTARALGADKFADIAYDHEVKSRAGEIEYVKTHWDELIAAWDNALTGLQEFYGRHRAEDDKYGVVNNSDGEVLKLSQSDLAEVVALLDDFETDQAIEKLKNWISSPLEQEMHELIKNVLIALEDEFDEDLAIKLLKEEWR